MRPNRRRTLGGLMLVIAGLALPLAWYAHRAREFARLRAEAEERAQIAAQAVQVGPAWKRLFEQAAVRTAFPPANQARRRADKALIRVDAPPEAEGKSFLDQARSVVELVDERARLEEEAGRSTDDDRERIGRGSRGESIGPTTPRAEPGEQPR